VEELSLHILDIVENSIRAGADEVEIRINEDEVADLLEIEINDNGPGIPPSMKEKIFDPYFTTKHKSNMHSGTGLGLFIAHQNMQDHGGAIEVMNNEHGGAKFILTLPDKVEN